MKRERSTSPIFDHVLNIQEKLMKSTSGGLNALSISQLPMCLLHPYLSTMTWDSNALLCFYVLKYPKKVLAKMTGK